MRYPKMSNFGMALFILAAIALSGVPSPSQTPAASGSLDQILQEVSTYAGGIDSAPFWKLRDYVYARKDNAAARAECESKLLSFLGTRVTPVAKMAACRMLRVIGSEKSVPVLQPMLLDKDAADRALYALQKIPGTAVDKALLQTLPKAEGPMKTEVIAALGERRCAEAVPPLSALLKPGNEWAGPAALALGEIGGEASANALVAGYGEMPSDIKPFFAASIMKCAERLTAAKRDGAALPLYEKLLADKSLSGPAREAAMIGKISASGSSAAALVLDQLKNSDPHIQEAAIIKVKDVIRPDGIEQVCKLVPSLPESAQIKLLATLSGYPKEHVLATVLQMARSTSAPVRIAALNALESVGDASTVSFLVETSARSRGAEQIAARDTLALIKGRPVDDAIVAMLAKSPAEDVQAELLLAIANRRIYSAKETVAGSLASAFIKVRTQAFRTLRSIGTPSDIPALLDILLKTADDAERLEAEATIGALSLKIADPNSRSGAVKSRFEEIKDPAAQARLCPVLARIGDDSALPLLRTSLPNRNEVLADAAARALTGWPTPAPRDDVAELARKSRNESHRLLAIQGLVRMIGLERYRKPEAAVADLRLTYLLASRPEEKRLILGVLTQFACADALDLAGIMLGDASVKAEAQAAIEKIRPLVMNP